MKILGKIKKGCEVFLEITMAFLLLVMVVTVFANVLGRFVFKSSIYWSEEVPRWCMVWMCFLGAADAYIKNQHMNLDIVANLLRGRGKRALTLVTNLIILFICVLILKGGIEMTIKNYKWISTATNITYSVLYASTVVSGAIFVATAVCKTVASVVSLIKNEEWNPLAEPDQAGKGGEAV